MNLWSPDSGSIQFAGLFPNALMSNAGAPTNGTAGTFAGTARPSSLLIDTTNFKLYQNAGTQLSPTWVVFEASGGTVIFSAADALAAHAGGAKAGATPITTEIASFGTVTTAGDSALLPPATGGNICILNNETANWMKLYGAGTDTINGVATATALIVPPHSTTLFNSSLAGAWETNLGAVPAVSQSEPAAPTAPASTSVYAMQGLAGSITPLKSGTIQVTISGDIIGSTTTAGDGIDIQISHGTGAAPANAAALAGTQDGAVMGYRNPATVVAADILAPFSTTAVITGLVAGTAYWLDLAAESIATASALGLTNVSISAIEVG